MIKLNDDKTLRVTAIWTALSILLAIGTQDVFAGRKEWTGFARGFDATWSNNDNWDGVGGAGPNDDLVFGDEVCGVFFCHSVLKANTTTNDLPINTSFDSLTFSGHGYNIRGNQIFLKNGLKSFADGTTFIPNVILGANQTWQADGSLSMNGVVNLNNRSLVITGGGKLATNSILNGGGILVMAGTGTVFINGNASSIGSLQISAGTVQVSGIVGSFVGMSGGTLSGAGNVGGILSLAQNGGGTIAPGSGGNLTGRLRSNGNVTLSPLTTLSIDLNGPAVGSQYDQLLANNGNINLAGADLDLSLGFVPTPGQQFTIVSVTGAGTVNGTFDQGVSIVKDNQLFAITYTGNSVVLTAVGQAVP